MNRIYKTIRRALTGESVVVSELAKGHGKSQNALTTTNPNDSYSIMPDRHQHQPHHTCHTMRPLCIALSALLLTTFGSGALAQQLIYDGTEALGTAPLKTADDAIFGTTGLPAWLNVNNATDQGVIYLDSGGAGNTVTTGADLVIHYTAGTTPRFVLGAYSNTGTAVEHNTVTLKQGVVNGSAFGGLSHRTHIRGDVTGANSGSNTSADASVDLSNTSVRANDNHLTVVGSLAPVTGTLYGGNATLWAQAGKATVVADVTASGVDALAHALASVNASNTTVTVSDNSVTLGKNARVTGSLYGGYAHVWVQGADATAGNASTNSGGVAQTHTRAFVNANSSVMAASSNTVVVGEYTSVTGDIYGGYAQLTAQAGHAIAANASSNMTSSNANADAYAVSANISASSNTISVGNGAVINGSLYGGYAGLKAAAGTAEKGSHNGSPVNASADVYVANTQLFADDNKITFNGALQSGSITGGYVQFDITQGTALNADNTLGNTRVFLTGTQAQAINNTVSIGDNAQFNSATGSLYGAYLEYNASDNFKPASYDVFTDNTLNWSAKAPATFQTVANFEHINFTLNPVYANQTTALITADDIALGANPANVSTGATTASKIAVLGIHSGNVLKAGDKFILMSATNSMSGSGAGQTSTGVTQAQQGISLLYGVQTQVDTNNKEVTAIILSGGVNPQLKALSEGYLAGAMLVTRGADMIADEAFSAIHTQNNQGGLAPFAMLSGSHSRYNSGSHVKSNDVLLTGGLSYQQDNLTLGAFLEAGWGRYDTYNSFYNAADVNGDGNSRYFGAGVLGRYDFTNGFYTDASLRFGRNHNKFDNDIQNIATGHYANYTLKSSYVSTHIGGGYVLPLNDKNELDLSAKYLYSTLGGKDILVAGDPIHFDRIDSHRTRINATLNHQYSPSLTLNAGLGYEYEFDGKANATTYGRYRIDTVSVEGGTGILSLGASVKPDTNQNLSLDFKLDGYTGKREGIGASIRINHTF